MLHRVYVLAICVLMYTVGSIIAGTYDTTHDNRHNWRAYLDGLSGGTGHVDAFRASCTSKHGSFSEPSPHLDHPHSQRDFGHILDRCWPPAPDSPRNPTSAVTSLGFIFVAAFRVSIVSPALAFLAGGSYRHHSAGDASGRALDHAAVGFLGAFMCVAVVQQTFEKSVYGRYLSQLANLAALAATCAVIAADNIEDNAMYASVAAVIAGVVLSLFRPPVFWNVLLPILLGQYLTMKASDLEHEAECTGAMPPARAYDRIHALWHVSVAAGASEAMFLAPSPKTATAWLTETLSPLSLCIGLAIPFALEDESADAAAATVFGTAALWCAYQLYHSYQQPAQLYAKLENASVL